MRVELHSHSIFSDGTLTPTELVSLAVKSGVDLLVLTDHDSVSGAQELHKAGIAAGIKTKLGIEINCSGGGASDRVHILGYGFNPHSPGFIERLTEFRQRRETRAKQIVEQLRSIGLGIDFKDVQSASHETIGRPHVADALVRLGIVKSRKVAFERFLVKGKPGFVESMGPSPQEAISLIRDAGGLACLAHPQTVGKEEDLNEIARLGLGAAEVFYSSHTPSQIRNFSEWAVNHKLIAFGGTDFHGPGTGREARLGVEYDERAAENIINRC